MKIIIKFLWVIILTALIISCSDDNTAIQPNDKSGEVTAKLREDIVLNFNSTSTTINNTTINQTVSRFLRADMKISGIETHILTITLLDQGNNSNSYSVEKGEAIVYYEMKDNPNYKFDSNGKGTITVTTLNDKQWKGSFQFELETQSGDKSIFVYSGNFDVSK